MPFKHCYCHQFAAMLALTLICATGCGSADTSPRVSIHGDVNGPSGVINSGSLSFVPSAGGPATGTSITDGKYELSKDRGPVPGIYIVRVTTSSVKTFSETEGPGALPAGFTPIQVVVPEAGGELQLRFTTTESTVATDQLAEPE